MGFVSDFLSHFWAVASIIITIYCFVTVRKPKFIVINKVRALVVANQNNLDIKFRQNNLCDNLYYERFLLCYIGANDTNVKDMEIPLSIRSSDDKVIFHEAEIIKSSSTFLPKLEIKSNEIQVASQSLKNGDVLDLHFYAESKTGKFHLQHRYFNVQKKIKYYNEDSYNKWHLAIWLISLVVCSFTIYMVQNFFLDRHRYKDDFRAEYNFQGYKVSEERQWESDLKVDSLFRDAHERRIKLETQKEKEYIEEKDVKSLLKSLSIDLNRLSNELADHDKYYDSLNLVKPSKLTDSVFKSLSKDNRLNYGEEVKVNNDLKIIFRNPKEDSLLSLLGYFLFTIITLLFLSLALIACTVTAIEMYYVNRIKKYINQ